MNSSRPRVVRLVVLGLIALLMAGCASIHPGSAAVVDGENISMKSADKAAKAYCKLGLVVAAQQGAKDVGIADTRRQTITELVTYKVATKLAKERHLTISPSTYVITDEQHEQLAKAFPHQNVSQISDAIERSQKTYAIIVALGEEATGEKMSTANQSAVENAGQSVIKKAIKDSDISIDPRFGLSDTTTQIAQSGSLSVPHAAESSNPTSLPASQRCS